MSLLRNRSLLGATLGHFSIDMYSGMLPLVLLVVKDPLGLSYGQVGLVSMVFSLSGSLSQPFFGWLGDRRGNRPLAVLGIAGIATTVGVMRFVGSFEILLALALIAGLGSGAFHPQGAVLAAQTERAQRGAAASIFMLGGNSGFAFGPLFNTALFSMTGAYLPETLMALGLTQAGLIFWLLAERQREFNRASKTPVLAATVAAPLTIIVTLMTVMFLRSWVAQATSTYVPQVFKALGYSDTEVGQLLFGVLFPLALGGLVGGTLSDKIGRRRVLIVSTALAGPALWLLLRTTGAGAYVVGALLGVAIGASFPVTLVMAQSLIPRGLGLMSGIVLGFTFIAGAIGVAVSGVFADRIGLVQTMDLNALMFLAAAGLAFFLPNDRPRAT